MHFEVTRAGEPGPDGLIIARGAISCEACDGCQPWSVTVSCQGEHTYALIEVTDTNPVMVEVHNNAMIVRTAA